MGSKLNETTDVGDKRTIFQKFAANILKAGEIPKHLGVIMDGNRRYSRANEITIAKGYSLGSEKLNEMCNWAFHFGIREVTAYVFSIENFKRAEAEKEIIFTILKRKLEGILEEEEKDGVVMNNKMVRVVGDCSLLPKDLQQVIAEITIKTRYKTGLILNLAIAYTSRNEISRASESLRKGVLEGNLEIGDICEELFTSVLHIHPTNAVDLLVRTSDTYRLSDFLLWQSSEGILQFLKCEWPDLSFWDLWKSIFQFQRSYQKLQNVKQQTRKCNCDETSKQRQSTYLENLRNLEWEKLIVIAESDQ